jgi:hypothetical protein
LPSKRFFAAAQALGLTVSPTLLALVDKVIQ